MIRYIAKRIIYFVPTLFLITLITFGLGKMSPGDPVNLALGVKDASSGDGNLTDIDEKLEANYRLKAENLGLDLPLFYFGIHSVAIPDTFHKIVRGTDQEVLSDLIHQYGNWSAISNYYVARKHLTSTVTQWIKTDTVKKNRNLLQETNQRLVSLSLTSDDKIIRSDLSRLDILTKDISSTVHQDFSKLKESYTNMQSQSTKYKNWIPTLQWNGSRNQYHRWLLGSAPWFGESPPNQSYGILRGDFGVSYQDGRPIMSKVGEAMGWTLSVNIISLIITFLIAIPLGIYSAVHRGKWTEKLMMTVTFMMYSLPIFWVAMLLNTFFTSSEYGMDFFPTYGTGEIDDDMNIVEIWGIRFYHLILPIFCLIYGGIAYLSRQMRAGMLDAMSQDYIRTAIAKGSPPKDIVWRHALKNSLLPIITIISSIFPSLIAGSFFVEWIFGIPGMGKLSIGAFLSRDFPMVYTVMLFSSILILIGNIVADIIYAYIDPRISFDKQHG